jgi:hypothetical protein
MRIEYSGNATSTTTTRTQLNAQINAIGVNIRGALSIISFSFFVKRIFKQNTFTKYMAETIKTIL